MALAGESAVAGRIPGERIQTDIDTADSSTFTTTETTVQSVAADLVTGRIYRVTWHTRFYSSVNTDDIIGRIREDNSTGTELQSGQVPLTNFSSAVAAPCTIEAEYTAVATGSKTFVGTGIRQTGTGNCFMEAATNHPSYLYVDYIRG